MNNSLSKLLQGNIKCVWISRLKGFPLPQICTLKYAQYVRINVYLKDMSIAKSKKVSPFYYFQRMKGELCKSIEWEWLELLCINLKS